MPKHHINENKKLVLVNALEKRMKIELKTIKINRKMLVKQATIYNNMTTNFNKQLTFLNDLTKSRDKLMLEAMKNTSEKITTPI